MSTHLRTKEGPGAKSRFVFFGTPHFATIVLDELEHAGLVPSLVVTTPDKPKGRKLVMTPSDVRIWSEARNIPVMTPSTLKSDEMRNALEEVGADCFVVAAYGKLIPKMILDIPPQGVLNVHPSLLPKFRGPSPIESAILSNEKETGVTIILLDEEMDHGPILARSSSVNLANTPKGSFLTQQLAHEGGKLLSMVMRDRATYPPKTQTHTQATFTKKITKEDGLLDLKNTPEANLKKIRAFDEWPGAYFFTERNGRTIRIKVTDAMIENGTLRIQKVIPEGKHEMSYDDLMRGVS
jgi:methionyl-tRNA formyltransferase